MKLNLHILSFRPVVYIAAVIVVCICTLFVSSRAFVGPQTTPKWIGVVLCAVNMCPVHFMPPYELAKLYEATGRHEDALGIAKQIINKKIKIPSVTITAIQNEMRQWLEKEGTRDSATQGGTSDEPNNDPTRQGETPEVSPRGSALPP
jgi:hypothetical protein